MMKLRNDIMAHAPALCQRFGIRRLCVFGSIARGEARASSDIDLLAEFDDPSPDTMPERYFGFLTSAEECFRRRVQLLTPRMIHNPILRRAIARDMMTVYER